MNSFASFLAARANEQIYNNASEKTRIVYACHYAGLIPAGPGKSHQSIRDISLLAALPNMIILEPASPAEAEMAVLSTQRIEEGKGGYRFALKTIEDWPAELVVMRTDDERIYEAAATVGRFEDRLIRAERLLDALQRQMLAFGAKRRFDRDDY